MKNDPQLFEAFMQGRNAAAAVECPFLWSSSMWEAWQAGRFAMTIGHGAPRAVASGRGSAVRTDACAYRITYRAGGRFQVVEA